MVGVAVSSRHSKSDRGSGRGTHVGARRTSKIHKSIESGMLQHLPHRTHSRSDRENQDSICRVELDIACTRRDAMRPRKVDFVR